MKVSPSELVVVPAQMRRGDIYGRCDIPATERAGIKRRLDEDSLPRAAPHPPTHLRPMIRVWPLGALTGRAVYGLSLSSLNDALRSPLPHAALNHGLTSGCDFFNLTQCHL